MTSCDPVDFKHVDEVMTAEFEAGMVAVMCLERKKKGSCGVQGLWHARISYVMPYIG